uniref:Adenylate-forming enzyme n=1 Tax=uncultured Armatimonadetes bacterium TaxID=157466 RepID=A0A6J4I0Q1_9BACT|nr:Adenylate-forming enzyme [uncultured Armatimonadetes bacterium]
MTARMLGHFVRARWCFTRLRGGSLRRYQERRARRIVAFADARAPFYHEHWRGRDLRDWRALPTVDKRQMMAHFDTFNTRGIACEAAMAAALRAEQSRDFAPTIEGLTVGLSSGTSGHRGLFLVGPEEQDAWAGTVLARTLHRLPRRGYRVAFFLRSNSNLYERVGGARVRFRYYDLMTPLPEAIARLNEYGPDLLVGPPSLLGMLADARAVGALGIRPERLLSVAEVLEPEDRSRLESVFGAPVHQVYQCTEGLLAATCPAGRLHVQEDLVALQYEPVEGDTARVTPVVTDLWRRVQPIVRYRLGDVLRLDPSPCPCGSTFQVLASIEGRCDDVCYFPHRDSGVGLRPFFPDTVRRMVLLASPDIADYQAVQERPGHLRVHLALPDAGGQDFGAVAAAVLASIADILAQYDCRLGDVEVEPGLVPVAPGAKRRRVRRTAGGPS